MAKTKAGAGAARGAAAQRGGGKGRAKAPAREEETPSRPSRLRAPRGVDQQETVLSFRVDHHLAEALNRLPDRSGFIRKAILRAFYRVCPACQGKGVLPEPAAKPIEAFIAKNLPARCDCCGFAYPSDGGSRKGAFVCQDCTEHDHGPVSHSGSCT